MSGSFTLPSWAINKYARPAPNPENNPIKPAKKLFPNKIGLRIKKAPKKPTSNMQQILGFGFLFKKNGIRRATKRGEV